MAVIYNKKTRRALASVDIDMLRAEMERLGFEFIRDGGYTPSDEPFKYSNFIFYKHPDSKIEIRIGHHRQEEWVDSNIFEICYATKSMKYWIDITPDFRKSCWRKVSRYYLTANAK